MNKHMELWNKVSKTDPKYIKPVGFGARKFTAIDPQYQVRSITEQFGAVGVGWGWNSTTEYIHFNNGDVAVVSGVYQYGHTQMRKIYSGHLMVVVNFLMLARVDLQKMHQRWLSLMA